MDTSVNPVADPAWVSARDAQGRMTAAEADAYYGALEAQRLGTPDPRVTGPCQLQASPFCTGEGIQRMDPMDMLDPSTSFARYVSACLDCYEARADRYVMEVHAR